MEQEAVRWFGVRFAVIFACSIIAYYMVGFFAPAHLLFSYRWITVSFVWFIGLFTVRWQYSNLPETEPSKQEFSWNKLKQNPGLSLFSQISSNPNPNSTSLQTQLTEANPPNPPLIREIETRTLTKPNQRVSFDDLVKQKILESLSRADVSVNIVVEREGGKWKITKAKSRIRTRKPKPTQTKPLEEFFRHGRRRVA